jgi:hypothetical protein
MQRHTLRRFAILAAITAAGFLITACTTDSATGKQKFNPWGWLGQSGNGGKVLAAIPDITNIVLDATSKSPNYAADISTGIDLVNSFAPGSKVPLAALQTAVQDGVNIATGGKLTSTSADIAAALKVLPDILTAAQATQALIQLSQQASQVSTAALSPESP